MFFRFVVLCSLFSGVAFAEQFAVNESFYKQLIPASTPTALQISLANADVIIDELPDYSSSGFGIHVEEVQGPSITLDLVHGKDGVLRITNLHENGSAVHKEPSGKLFINGGRLPSQGKFTAIGSVNNVIIGKGAVIASVFNDGTPVVPQDIPLGSPNSFLKVRIGIPSNLLKDLRVYLQKGRIRLKGIDTPNSTRNIFLTTAQGLLHVANINGNRLKLSAPTDNDIQISNASFIDRS